LFVTDLDLIHYAPLPANALEGTPRIAISFTSVNNPFTYGANYREANPTYRVDYPHELVQRRDTNNQ